MEVFDEVENRRDLRCARLHDREQIADELLGSGEHIPPAANVDVMRQNKVDLQ